MGFVRALRYSTGGRSLPVAWVCGGLLVLMAAALTASPSVSAERPGLVDENPANAAPAASQLLPATVRFAQAVYTAPAGAEFSVDVVVDGAGQLAGWQAALVFDPAYLQILAITGGGLITSAGRVETILGPWVDSPGRILIGAYTRGQAPGASGSGLLAHVRLRSLTQGASALALEQVLLTTLDPTNQVDTQAATATGSQIIIEAPVAVSLASFAAHAATDGIVVTWETASELDNQGFNLYRAADPAAPQDLLAFVPSQAPGSSQGFVYEWLDNGVTAGETYYYWLEAVDTNGATSLHGPVSATILTPSAVTVDDVQAAASAPGVAGWWVFAGVLALLAGAAKLAKRR